MNFQGNQASFLEAYPQKRHQKGENLERKNVSLKLARIGTFGAKFRLLLFFIEYSYFLAY